MKNLILLIILYMSTVSLFAQSKICVACNGKIEGNYITVEGQIYHPQHFVCSVCKKVIEGSYMKDDKNFLHQECYTKAKNLFCKECGKALQGEYVRYENGLYHKECFANRVQKKCVICNTALEGYYVENEFGQSYHSKHKAEYSNCFSCNRLMAPGICGVSRTYNDGRKICTECVKEYIPMDGEFPSVMRRVIYRLKDIGLTVRQDNISITGVSRTELKRKMGSEYAEGARGYCHSVKNTETRNGNIISENIQHSIYVLNGLPQTQTEGIIAHELMHAWMFENSNKKLTQQQNEGSCNLVSWYYLRSLQNEKAKTEAVRIENDEDPVYGGGFRLMKSNYRSLNDLLNALKK